MSVSDVLRICCACVCDVSSSQIFLIEVQNLEIMGV